jgi:Spy/CpxP family protein refolding chaperone
MIRKIVVLFVAVVFLMGSSLAFANCGTCGMGGEKAHKRGMKGMTVDDKLAKLTKKLDLTADQQAKVKDIVTKERADAKAVWDDAMAKKKSIKTAANDKIKALLTAEQKAKFDAIREKKSKDDKDEE